MRSSAISIDAYKKNSDQTEKFEIDDDLFEEISEATGIPADEEEDPEEFGGDFDAFSKFDVDDEDDEEDEDKPEKKDLFDGDIETKVKKPRWKLRMEPYDPDAKDADGDGIVQEGTAWERPAGVILLNDQWGEIPRGQVAARRPTGLKYIDATGAPISYTPTYERDSDSKPAPTGIPTLGEQARGERPEAPNSAEIRAEQRRQAREARRQRRAQDLGGTPAQPAATTGKIKEQQKPDKPRGLKRIAQTLFPGYKPKDLNGRLAELTTKDEDSPIGASRQMFDPETGMITDVNEGVKHLLNGGSLDAIANHIWLDVLEDSTISSGDPTDKDTLFHVKRPEQGAVGDTWLFHLRDENGNPTNQGFVFKAVPGQLIDSAVEVAGFNILEGLGMLPSGATFDGRRSLPNWGGDYEDGIYAVLPMVYGHANADTLADVQLGRYPYYRPTLENLDFKGLPEMAAGFLTNMILGVEDRNRGNTMIFRDGDTAFVIPIDLGWGLKHDANEATTPWNYLKFYFCDNDLPERSVTYYQELLRTDPERAQQYKERIAAQMDELITRAQAIANLSTNEFLDSILGQVDLTQIMDNLEETQLLRELTKRFESFKQFAEMVSDGSRRDWLVDYFTDAQKTRGDWIGDPDTFPFSLLDAGYDHQRDRDRPPPRSPADFGRQPPGVAVPLMRAPQPATPTVDDAIKQIFDDLDSSLDDIPEQFAPVVVLNNLKDSRGRTIDPDKVAADGFSSIGQPGDTWESDRFKVSLVKSPPRNWKGGVWEVVRVTDKNTGDEWYMKASEFGNDEAILERVGNTAAEVVGFPTAGGNIKIGERRKMKGGTQGRWVMVRSVDQWDTTLPDGSPAIDQTQWLDATTHFLVNGGNDLDDTAQFSVEELTQMLVMDYVLNNLDRHPGNFLVGSKDGELRIMPIDHSLIGGGRGRYQRRLLRRPKRQSGADYLKSEATQKGNESFFEYAYSPHGWTTPSGLKMIFDQYPEVNPFVERGAEERVTDVVARTAAQLRENLDRILDVGAADLSDTEQAHLDAIRDMALQRLAFLETPEGRSLGLF